MLKKTKKSSSLKQRMLSGVEAVKEYTKKKTKKKKLTKSKLMN